MNRLLLTATLLAFDTSGIYAQNYNPKFDQGLGLKEFVESATNNSSGQEFMPVPLVVFDAAKTILIIEESKLGVKKGFLKAGPGYFFGPYRPWVLNNVPYQNGLVYVPHLQGMEHPTAYKLLAQWDGVNTTRAKLLDDADVIDPKDKALYAEAVQLDQNAAVLNQELDKINAEIARFNQTCVGVPYPPSYCPSWSVDLDRRIADLKRRINTHNAKVADFRNRKKTFDGVVETFGNKILSWGEYINDFIAKTQTFLSYSGTCTKEEHYQLQQVVNTACSPAIIRACKKGQDCDLLRENLRKFEACIKARKDINDKCYGGGDPGHNEQIANMTNGAKNCISIIKEDCADRIGGGCNGEDVRRVVFETAN